MTTSLNDNDSWNSEEFEDTVAAAIIAFYESKIKKNRGTPPPDRLGVEQLKLFRMMGPYIPSSSRVILHTGEHKGFFDTKNDVLPTNGCLSFSGDTLLPKSSDRDNYVGYLYNFYVSKVSALGKYWKRQDSGQLYVMYLMVMTNKGVIDGERRYFTVNNKGEVLSCLHGTMSAGEYGEKAKFVGASMDLFQQTTDWASVTLQYITDRRFSWVKLKLILDVCEKR